MLELGDVVLFEDIINEKERKVRPLVILKTINDNGSVVGVRCTTKTRDYDDYSYEIVDWQACGLAKPSSVRCDKMTFLKRQTLFADERGNPKVVAKLTPTSINKVVEHFERYQQSIASIATELKEATKEQLAYAIKVTETIDGNDTVQYKIYDDENVAKERYSKCYPEFTRTVINGKMVDVNTHYELGTIKVIDRIEVDEQSFTKISATTDLAQHNSINLHKSH